MDIVFCVLFILSQPYVAICYGHAMFKCCQYVTNDIKVCNGMWEVFIKDVQSSLHKTITWTKNNGKGKQEWAKACKDSKCHIRKQKTDVKTRFTCKVILLKKTLEF